MAKASVFKSCPCAKNVSQQCAIKFENGKKRNVHPLLVDRKQTFPVLDSGFLVYSGKREGDPGPVTGGPRFGLTEL